MKILNIEFIFLMLIPAIFLLYLIVTNKSEVERVFDSEVLQKLKINMGLDKNTKIFLLFSALFFMIFAMSRPVIQKGVIEVKSKKASVVLALDISKSMLSSDIYPNRLEFAKQKMVDFIKRSKNFDIGIVAFAKEAFIVSPITSDKEALLFLLNNLDTRSITLQGTNFVSAIEIANILFEKSKDKNLIIFSDGGDESDFSKIVDIAKKEGVKVSVVAIGSKKGAPIPEDGGFLKDKRGNLVITKLNINIKDLATNTKGVFLVAKSSDQDIKELLSKLNVKKKKITKQKIVDQIELYPYFLTVSLFLLFAVFFSFFKKDEIFLKSLVFFVVILASNLNAGIFDFKDIKSAKEYYEKKKFKKAIEFFEKVANEKKSAQSFYDLANAYYKAKMYKEAIKNYNKVQTPNKELERFKLHNLGNSYFKLKNYKKAIEFYEKALKIKEDKDTRFNLELAKKMLKNSQKSTNQNRQKNNKKNKKDNQKSSKSTKEQKKDKKDNQKSKKSTKEQKKDKKDKEKSAKASKKNSKNQKSIKKIKNEPISKREEKKWLKEIQKLPKRTLIYKVPTKHKGIEVEKPW